MKRLVVAALVALVLGFAPNAHALPAFINNGGNLIYDTSQNITWYDFTLVGPPEQIGLVYWHQATDWAATLNTGGVSGWRLPTTPGAAAYSYTSEGEMGQLYVELGNTLGNSLGQFGLSSVGPFTTWLGHLYWTSTPDPNGVSPYYGWYVYYFNVGFEGGGNINSAVQAIAVHDGDVLGNGVVLPNGPVPIPGAILLFGSGLLGLAGWRRFRKG